MELILASGSPRRKELLERMGLTFTVQPSNVDEKFVRGADPALQVLRLSKVKALALPEADNQVIIAADTIVVLLGEILGKPKNELDAERMLRALSGQRHAVLTGVTVRRGQQLESWVEGTEVYFRTLSKREIAAYVKTGEPMDKAGAYGIQGLGAMFVEKLVGDYYNVMGLPVCRVTGMLRRAGIRVLEEEL